MKFSLCLLFILMGAVSIGQSLSPREGYVQVEGGKVWYKIIGTGAGTPLLYIHGGPGSTHCPIIDAYSLISDQRPMIFYDQLGCGLSDHPTDTTLWRPERFANEIDSIRKALHLSEIVLMGQSWGGTVLIDYLSKNPAGVQSAIFASPLISTDIWMKDAKALLSDMPKPVKDTIRKYEALRVYDGAEYKKATELFYARHYIRKPSTKWDDCKRVHQGNDELYLYMWGPTEFSATGTLKPYNRINDLKKLNFPVLFIAGEFDEVRQQTLKRFHKKVNGSKMIILTDSGHFIQYDQPVLFCSSIADFLKEISQSAN